MPSTFAGKTVLNAFVERQKTLDYHVTFNLEDGQSISLRRCPFHENDVVKNS